MDKWNLIVDVAKCNNCASCTLASMDEHIGNDFPGYAAPQAKSGQPWLEMKRHVRGEGVHVDVTYMPTMCNHCDNAACGAGRDEAVIKRPDGIVLIDPFKAKGRRDLVEKCPYGAIRWNEELQLPQIWIFDAHLLDAGWRQPRCQQVCAAGAYRAVKISDEKMAALAKEEGLQVSHPEFGTRPRIYYKNLHRVLRRFVAGTVLGTRNGVPDCLEASAVYLWRGGKLVAQVKTDWFGEFKIDDLPDESVQYELVLEHADFEPERLKVQTDVVGKVVRPITLQCKKDFRAVPKHSTHPSA